MHALSPFVIVCVFCACVCLHIRAPPADSPLSARHGNRFTLPSSPVDVEVCAKITIDIAMVTVTRVALRLSACVHVRGGHHVSCGGWLCFSRGIAGVTLAGRRGLQLQPLVNNVAPLLAAAAGGEKERRKKKALIFLSGCRGNKEPRVALILCRTPGDGRAAVEDGCSPESLLRANI